MKAEKMRNHSTTRRVFLGAALSATAFGASGCTQQFANHGYVPTQEELDSVVVGKDTRETVTQNIGAPSSAGLLRDSGFYYVKSRKRSFGFLAPREVERQVVAISFDTRGVVSNVERFGLEKGQVVALERRVTSSAVNNNSFLRQLLGSIGNFSPAALGG